MLRLRLRLTLALVLVLPLALSQPLLHLPLTRRPLPASRAFSLRRRPWLPPHIPRGPKLHPPLTLLNHTWPSARALPTHPLYGDIVTLGEYYLTLGFADQPINVQIDTGSSTLAVPLSECRNCRTKDHRLRLADAKGDAGLISCESSVCRPRVCNRSGLCKVCSRYSGACCATQAPAACAFFLSYADESGASGALVQADVTVAGLTVPLAFGGILSETEQFENAEVDGILGLAYKSLACNPTCVTPLFDKLVEDGLVERDIFSICTGRNGGTLVLGGSSPQYYEGQLQYVPLIGRSVKQFYDVAINHVKIGDHKVSIPSFSDAIVDSGTTVLVITESAYNAIKSHFQTNYCHVPGLCTDGRGRQVQPAHVVLGPKTMQQTKAGEIPVSEKAAAGQSWFTPGYCGRLTEAHIQMLPNITIALHGGVELVLDPDVYMLEYEASSMFGWEKVIYRCLGIAFLDSLDLMENNAIMGNTVLQKYFVEYDRQNDRVGFAIAKNCVNKSAELLITGTASSKKQRGLPKWLLISLAVGSVGAWVLLLAVCARESRKHSQYAPIPSSS